MTGRERAYRDPSSDPPRRRVGLVLAAGVALLLANRPMFFDANAAFLFGLFGATSAAYAAAGTLPLRRERT